MADFIQIHPKDTVAVALRPIPAGTCFQGVTARCPIPQGHKMALIPLKENDPVIKYGFPIGHVTAAVLPGDLIHTHNLSTGLSGERSYGYRPNLPVTDSLPPACFQGYRREEGKVGIRNELWILPAVGCVNEVAKALVKENQDLVCGSIDGLYAFPHPFGCSQTGADHAQTRKLLAALAKHPNAGGVLILHLGCENLTREQFAAELGDYDPRRIQFLTCQQVSDEMEAGRDLLKTLAAHATQARREEVPASELVIGMKCGGSDGLSGITANPLLGCICDTVTAMGGSALLTEVPEMFGAEDLLMDRCISEAVFRKAVDMVNCFKQYFLRYNETIYENPSPGNKAGGITTLEDKSCGCVQKGGSAPIVDVLDYGDILSVKGLNLLYGPGNDLVSTTALTAAGAQMILFTTGRGTPFGAPAPTIKVSSNTPMALQKANWMDFNAGVIADGTTTLEETTEKLMMLILETASGKQTKAEERGYREIAIFKDGVVL